MIKDILKELINAVSTMGGIHYTAVNWGQLDMDQPPVQWPCALVEINEVEFTHLSGRNLQGEAVISVLIADLPIRQSSARASQKTQENTFNFYDLLEKAITHLNGWASEYNTPLSLQSCRKIGAPGLNVYELSFVTAYRLLAPQPTTLLVQPNINVAKI